MPHLAGGGPHQSPRNDSVGLSNNSHQRAEMAMAQKKAPDFLKFPKVPESQPKGNHECQTTQKATEN